MTNAPSPPVRNTAKSPLWVRLKVVRHPLVAGVFVAIGHAAVRWVSHKPVSASGSLLVFLLAFFGLLWVEFMDSERVTKYAVPFAVIVALLAALDAGQGSTPQKTSEAPGPLGGRVTSPMTPNDSSPLRVTPDTAVRTSVSKPPDTTSSTPQPILPGAKQQVRQPTGGRSQQQAPPRQRSTAHPERSVDTQIAPELPLDWLNAEVERLVALAELRAKHDNFEGAVAALDQASEVLRPYRSDWRARHLVQRRDGAATNIGEACRLRVAQQRVQTQCPHL